MRCTLTGVLLLLCAYPIIAFSQDASGPADKIIQFPSSFFQKTRQKAASLDDKISSQTEKYLRRLAKQEDRLRKQLSKHDSAAAARLFGAGSLDYASLLQAVHSKGGSVAAGAGAVTGSGVAGSAYIPNLDTLKTSLAFLQQNKNAVPGLAGQDAAIASSLAQVNQLQDKIKLSSQISQLVRQRREEIRQALASNAHLPSALQNGYAGYSKEAYYYGAQLKTYTDELNSPDKLTQRAVGVLNQSPAYQSFFKSHSELAGLFSLPGGSASGSSATPLAGLQTRSNVQEQLHGKVASGGSGGEQVVQQNIQAARTKLLQLKDKVLAAGGGNSSVDVPDFRPNTQKTKRFWNRVEYGVNFQSLPSSYAFPVTSDIGGSLGYRLNDRNTFGIGMSYKIGWGKDLGHIALSSQGLGLRSFWDMKIKGSFYATGGLEYNYMTPFNSLQQIQRLNFWTRSGLVGLTKTVSFKNRVFSKTKVQLLWDFLSYSQVPKTEAVVFRVGYTWH